MIMKHIFCNKERLFVESYYKTLRFGVIHMIIGQKHSKYFVSMVASSLRIVIIYYIKTLL